MGELSEKSSDVLDPTIKYGGGPAKWRSFLTSSSRLVAACDKCEEKHSEAMVAYEVMVAAHEKFKKATVELLEHHLPDHEVQEIRGKLEDSTREMGRAEQKEQKMRGELVYMRNRTADRLKEAISWLDDRKRQKQ